MNRHSIEMGPNVWQNKWWVLILVIVYEYEGKAKKITIHLFEELHILNIMIYKKIINNIKL